MLLTSNEPNHNWSAILSGSLDAYAGLDLVSAREVRRSEALRVVEIFEEPWVAQGARAWAVERRSLK